MKEFTNEDIKRVGLDILDVVHKFCVDHNLKYTLAYGTLLGAIRHKGYIPWDDDIDIAMPREDYETFLKTFDVENYGVMSCWNNPHYFLTWAKVYDKRTIKIENAYNPEGLEIGFNIDIFPLDSGDDLEAFHKMKKKYKNVVKKHHYSMFPKSKGKSPVNLIKNIVIGYLNKRSNKYARVIEGATLKHFKGKESNLLVQFDVYDINRDYIFHKDTFNKLVPVKFEDRTYLATEYYDFTLKASYGDYMTPPPVEKRPSLHSFKAYFK